MVIPRGGLIGELKELVSFVTVTDAPNHVPEVLEVPRLKAAFTGSNPVGGIHSPQAN